MKMLLKTFGMVAVSLVFVGGSELARATDLFGQLGMPSGSFDDAATIEREETAARRRQWHERYYQWQAGLQTRSDAANGFGPLLKDHKNDAFQFRGSFEQAREVKRILEKSGYSLEIADLNRTRLNFQHMAVLERHGMWLPDYFKRISVVGVVAGVALGTSGAAQAATVREDIANGGAPVKLENSNVGASTDFESYGTAPVNSNSSRSTR